MWKNISNSKWRWLFYTVTSSNRKKTIIWLYGHVGLYLHSRVLTVHLLHLVENDAWKKHKKKRNLGIRFLVLVFSSSMFVIWDDDIGLISTCWMYHTLKDDSKQLCAQVRFWLLKQCRWSCRRSSGKVRRLIQTKLVSTTNICAIYCILLASTFTTACLSPNSLVNYFHVFDYSTNKMKIRI